MSAPQPFPPSVGGLSSLRYEMPDDNAREWWRWYFAGQIAAQMSKDAILTTEERQRIAERIVGRADDLIAALEAKR